MSRKCLASVLQVSASVSQVSRKSLTSVSQVPSKCLASVTQVSRKCQTSRECIGETSIVYAYVKGATVECVYLGWLRPPPGAPQQQWCLRECECDVRVDRHATTQGVSYAIRTTFRLFLSQKTVQRCRSRTGAVSTHYVSVLSITQRRLHLGILRTTHHVSAY